MMMMMSRVILPATRDLPLSAVQTGPDCTVQL